MHFLEIVEIEEWCAKRKVELEANFDDESNVLLRRYFGQAVSPVGQERDIAIIAADALGDWDECLVWVTQWGIWGSSEDWPKYYAARGAEGERRSLQKAPGHLFERNDRPAFIYFLQLVMENAWDASVMVAREGKTTGHRIRVSHDECIEVLKYGRG